MNELADFPIEPKKIEEAEDALLHPYFFDYLTKVEIPKKIVGEMEAIHTIFLCSCGRLVENAKKTSYNLIVNDETGVGKDWVTEKTLEIWKDVKDNYHTVKTNKDGTQEIMEKETEIVIKKTRISEKVFTYWHNPKFEPDWSWDGKVFYNEDISQNVLNSDVFRVMASSGSSATVLINQFPTDINIIGKPVMIVTTAAAMPDPENLRRFTLINLDSSTNQTVAIMERQAEAAATGTVLEYNEHICQALCQLQRVKVKVPFALELSKFFPKEKIIMRTVFERFLDYIKASVALHQKQRQVDLDGYILAEPQDYNIARTALLKTVNNPFMIPTTKDQKRLLVIIKAMGDEFWSVSEIEGNVTFMSDKWLRINLDRLADMGVLEKGSDVRENSKRRVMVYKAREIGVGDIPSWEKLYELYRELAPYIAQYPLPPPSLIVDVHKDTSKTNNILNTISTIDTIKKKKYETKEPKEEVQLKLVPDKKDREEADKKYLESLER